jgi:hypothetical protein
MAIRRPPATRKPATQAKKKQTVKPAGNKVRLAAGRKDALATTATRHGKLSPDYKKRAGDPSFLRSYSEEQIGLLGGRKRIDEVVAAHKRMGGNPLVKGPGGSAGKVAPWENLDAPTGTLMLGKPEKEEATKGGKGKAKKPKSKGRGGRSKGGRKGQTIRTNKPRRKK